MDHTTHQTRLFAGNAAGAGWWLFDALYRYGPSWQLVPPILIALASVMGAVRSYQDGAQARRHAEEKHQEEIEQYRQRLEQVRKRMRYDPLQDGLEGRT
jgi:hypothetical protein